MLSQDMIDLPQIIYLFPLFSSFDISHESFKHKANTSEENWGIIW